MSRKESLISKLIDFLYPISCYGCQKSGYYLCPKCFRKQHLSFVHRCHVCGKESRVGFVHKECSEQTFLDGVLFVSYYTDLIKRLVKDVKYKYYFSILDDLSVVMSKYLQFYSFDQGAIFTSVPLHKKKKNIRGFNQAELLGRRISKLKNFRYMDLLERTRYTKTQVGLGKGDRGVNLKEAFKAKNLTKEIREVMIIDDVYTTGATLNECAKILKQNGVEKVYGFVFARSRE